MTNRSNEVKINQHVEILRLGSTKEDLRKKQSNPPPPTWKKKNKTSQSRAWWTCRHVFLLTFLDWKLECLSCISSSRPTQVQKLGHYWASLMTRRCWRQRSFPTQTEVEIQIHCCSSFFVRSPFMVWTPSSYSRVAILWFRHFCITGIPPPLLKVSKGHMGKRQRWVDFAPQLPHHCF